MGPWRCEPRTSRSTDRPKRSSCCDRVAVLGVRLDAQVPDQVPRLGYFVIDALLETPGIAYMEAGYGVESRKRGVAAGGERLRYGEDTIASRRAIVGDADRLQGGWASGISGRRDGYRAWRVIEQLARVVADEVAIDLVLAGRADDQQVGVSGARDVVQTSPHITRLSAHDLGVQSRFIAQRCEALQCILVSRRSPRRARVGRGLGGHDLHVSKRQVAIG